MDFSQLLAQKTDMILERWVEAVRADRQIGSADELPDTALKDHLGDILMAIVTVLSQFQDSDIQPTVYKSLEHGVLRAAQGFAPTEIAREYRLLRRVLFSTLTPDLLKGSLSEVMRVYSLIDETLDEAIAQCFKSYVSERLRELELLQSQLTLTNQELTRLISANQDNLSVLAHELKNPLTSIIGYSDLYLRQQRKNTEVRSTFPNLEHIERVLRNGRHLLRLVNDALEVSRYESGQMKLHPEPTDVRCLINNVFEMLEPMARAKGQKILIDCERAPNQVLTDPLRLQQIVTNLLSNAIRYTESGSVQVTCQMLSDHRWMIEIADTGVGISPADQPRIFEPFFRAGVPSTHSPDSTGLGLAIVAQLVKLMQGKIELETQVGVGSTFSVILPLEVKTIEAVERVSGARKTV